MANSVTSTEVQEKGVGEDALTHYLRLFTRFLQVVHATWDKSNYRWAPDDKNTDIIIQGEGSVNKEVVERRPAIVVSRSPAAWGNVSMDQFAGPLRVRDPRTGAISYTANSDVDTGARRHTDLVSATITFNALSKEGLEAARIAWFCSYATRVLKKSLMKAGIHRVGEDIQIGSESPPGALVQPDSTEIICVPVYVPFYFQNTYTISPKDKILLNQVDIALSSEVGYPAQGAVPIRDPGINGRILGYSSVLTLNQAVSAGPFKPPRPLK